MLRWRVDVESHPICVIYVGWWVDVEITLMCVMCVGLWVDMDSHPDACLCCIVCCTYWIVGRRGNVTRYVLYVLDCG